MAEPSFAPSGSPRLRELYEEDQNDRRRVYDSKAAVAELMERDGQRRTEVLDLMAQGKASSADDLYHAAVVLQHAKDKKDFLAAHRLATMSAILGSERALWLVAATLDRFLMAADQPQVYGTQFEHRHEGNQYELKRPIDDSTVMSFEKKFFNVPKAVDRLAELNGRIRKKS